MRLLYRSLLAGGLLLKGTAGVFAQSGVGIGTTTPHPSAVLDLSATAKGLLVPRLTGAQRAAISAPAVGLLVYQTDGSEGFYFYSAGGWTWLNPLGGADNLGNHTATQAMNLQSNPLTGSTDSLLVPGIGVTPNGGLNIGQHDLNLRIGFRAGKVAAASGVNQFVGYYAGLRNTTGAGNLFEGFMAGRDNTTGNFNVFSGYASGSFNSTGSQNTGVGIGSGGFNTTGGFNVFVGSLGGANNTTGSNNLFAGYNAGAGNRTGSNNLALGSEARLLVDGLTNAGAIGANAQVGQSNSLVLGGTGANAVQVGIGTTAPAATLHVAGATSTVRFDGLAGTGTRMLTADAAGNVGTQAVPVDTDQQQLSKTGNTISLTNGGSVTDSDNQLLSRTGSTVTLTNGGAITLPDASASNELQTISKAGNIISLSNGGGSVTDTDTDAQTLSVSGGNLSISGGNSVALTSLDAQQLSKTGNTISLTNGGSVTDSDNQSLSISGSTISLTDGGSVTVPSSADNLGNHTATQNLNLGPHTLTGNGGTTGLQISANGRLLTTADNLIAGKNTGNGTLTGINNTVLGSQSGASLTTGSANTLTGVNAGIALTTGNDNTFYGVAAGDNTTTGGSNVAIGRSSGTTNVTGAGLTLLGAGADVIGTGLTNATAIGRSAKVSQSNALVLGGTGSSAVQVGIGTTAPGATLEVAGAASTVRFGGLAGTGVRLVNVDASGNLSTQTVASVGDNLGNHTATQNLNLGASKLVGNGGTGGLSISNTGVTTVDNNLNLGANRLVGNGGTVGLSISNTGVTTTGGNINLGTNKLVGNNGTTGLSVSNTGVTTVDNNLNLGTSKLVGNGGTSGINIASNGNVGINDTNPNQKLDVVGDVKISEAVFARALAGIEYDVEFGPDQNTDNQDHIVQCNTGWAITSVQAYATTHLDGNLGINCMRLSGIIDETAPAVWRYGPGIGADNQNHTVNCQTGEVATGWRITATDYLDGNVGLLCRPLADGYSRSVAVSTTTMQSTLDSRGLNDSYMGATCPAGTVLIYLSLYARDRLETLLDMRCARIIAQ